MNLYEPEYKNYVRSVLSNNLPAAIYLYACIADGRNSNEIEYLNCKISSKYYENKLVDFLNNILKNNVLTEASGSIENWKTTGSPFTLTGESQVPSDILMNYTLLIEVASSFVNLYYKNLQDLHTVLSYFENLQEDLNGIVERLKTDPRKICKTNN